MPPRRTPARNPVPDDNLSFNSRLSGDDSAAIGTAGSRRKGTQPGQGRGLIEFFVGSKRNNYSTPVYLFMVFVVSIILWGALPWLMHGFEELALEERIAALESRGPGSGGSGISAAQLAELKKLKAEVQGNLKQMKEDKAAMDKTISQFEAQQKMSASASAGDLSSVTANIAKMESDLKGMTSGAAKYETSISALQKKMEGMEGQLGQVDKKHQGAQKDLKANQEGVASANSQIKSLEAKIKETHRSIDGLSSTVARKCAGPSTPGLEKTQEKPNFALRCAGAIVEDVTVAGANLVDYLQGLVYRYTNINFDHDNPQSNVLDSSNEPGECWCFAGQEANLTVALITPMVPNEFFIHHIQMDYYNKAKIDMGTAAPKDFTVVGINDDGESVLGDFTYDAGNQEQKGLSQVFAVHQNHGKIFPRVKVVFRASNHWAPGRKYTCVYQFGVHGTAAGATA